MTDSKFYLIGCATGMAGADIHSGDGPLVLRNSTYLSSLNEAGIEYAWKDMLTAPERKGRRMEDVVAESCLELATLVSTLVKKSEPVCVVGGDHSCAIGTWSGVYDAMHDQGELGLIWIDAHMDSHTPETSLTGNIHGMPLACLLGYGYPALTKILHDQPKLKPQNVCLIGVRSYESGEAELLRKLNVRVFFMEEVNEKGFDLVMQEAVAHVTRHTAAFGLSVDIDSVDPEDAPGVDVPEASGISGEDLCAGLTKVANDPRLIATEIVEFDPGRDVQAKTEKLMANVVKIFAVGALG
jgi:arginase